MNTPRPAFGIFAARPTLFLVAKSDLHAVADQSEITTPNENPVAVSSALTLAPHNLASYLPAPS